MDAHFDPITEREKLKKEKRLTKWCGLLSMVLISTAALLRYTVGGIGISAITLMLSSVYIVALVVIYNRDEILNRALNVIIFLASMSLILWLLCVIAPQIYERAVYS